LLTVGDGVGRPSKSTWPGAATAGFENPALPLDAEDENQRPPIKTTTTPNRFLQVAAASSLACRFHLSVYCRGEGLQVGGRQLIFRSGVEAYRLAPQARALYAMRMNMSEDEKHEFPHS
jgi:hypothetical protein